MIDEEEDFNIGDLVIWRDDITGAKNKILKEHVQNYGKGPFKVFFTEDNKDPSPNRLHSQILFLVKIGLKQGEKDPIANIKFIGFWFKKFEYD